MTGAHAHDTARKMRPARLADADRIADYQHACRLVTFAPLIPQEALQSLARPIDHWQEWLVEGSTFTTVVAVNQNDLAIGHTTVRGCFLLQLFVDPSHWRTGVGRQLLVEGERLIALDGHHEAELHTRVGNAPALALYESTGWVMTDELATSALTPDLVFDEHVLRKRL